MHFPDEEGRVAEISFDKASYCYGQLSGLSSTFRDTRAATVDTWIVMYISVD